MIRGPTKKWKQRFSLLHLHAEWEPDVWLWKSCKEKKTNWCRRSKHPHRNLDGDLQVTIQTRLPGWCSHTGKADSRKIKVSRLWFNVFKNRLTFLRMWRSLFVFVVFMGRLRTWATRGQLVPLKPHGTAAVFLSCSRTSSAHVLKLSLNIFVGKMKLGLTVCLGFSLSLQDFYAVSDILRLQ